SALLNSTMPVIKTVIDALAEAGLRDSVKVLIGGAPITQAYSDEVGSDGYAADAAGAVAKARNFVAAK
ncbi:MAG: cobalamin-binding protein, partial [Firmicutes bacterium]|nr:cobalamin-binding protein [Bacillota bacterium]